MFSMTPASPTTHQKNQAHTVDELVSLGFISKKKVRTCKSSSSSSSKHKRHGSTRPPVPPKDISTSGSSSTSRSSSSTTGRDHRRRPPPIDTSSPTKSSACANAAVVAPETPLTARLTQEEGRDIETRQGEMREKEFIKQQRMDHAESICALVSAGNEARSRRSPRRSEDGGDGWQKTDE